jgi:hypothetical protein
MMAQKQRDAGSENLRPLCIELCIELLQKLYIKALFPYQSLPTLKQFEVHGHNGF